MASAARTMTAADTLSPIVSCWPSPFDDVSDTVAFPVPVGPDRNVLDDGEGELFGLTVNMIELIEGSGSVLGVPLCTMFSLVYQLVPVLVI
jgi:hypothetical protein